MGLGFCCCGCTIFGDDFDRADDTDVGGDWTEVAGNWAIASNWLRASTAGDLIIANKSYSTDNAVWEAVIKPDTAALGAGGKKVRLIVDYVDASNYHFCEIRHYDDGGPISKFRLGVRTAGTDTYLTSENGQIVLMTQTMIRVCITASTLSFFAGVSGSQLSGAVAITPHGGNQVGFRIEDSNTTDFNNAALYKHTNDDPTCEFCRVACAICTGDEGAPVVLRVTLPNFTNNGCGDCTDHNGQEIEVPFLEAFGEELCYWEAEVPSGCGPGGSSTLLIEIVDNLDGTITISADLESIAIWQETITKPTCAGLSASIAHITDRDCATTGDLQIAA